MSTSDVHRCLACGLASGRLALPGGVIAETDHWRVEHCVGPLGVGALVVKPKRHVTRVSQLSDSEAAELGPLLRDTAAVVDEILAPEQVYVCLWSHAGGVPGHIHYVVQPVSAALMREYGLHGPSLQVSMFDRGETPPVGEVEAFATRARGALAARARLHAGPSGGEVRSAT